MTRHFEMLEEGIDTTLQNVSTDKGILKKTSAVQKRIPELTNEIIKKKISKSLVQQTKVPVD